ncbi:MAG: leucine-rich repeat domain-containing protein [Clostridia bacterium]|nr:leucine-rich repeat domain-containing protein [Clostridia bacterium]
MKKVVCLFMVLLVIILFTSCQQQNNSIDDTSSVDSYLGDNELPETVAPQLDIPEDVDVTGNIYKNDTTDMNFYYYFKDEYFARSVARAMNKDPYEAVTEEELASFSGKISVFDDSESLAGIGYLKSITELSVAKCLVEEIPSEISQCKNLKKLDLLKAFFLKKLPENIGELKELEYINVMLTSLENLPESIGNLKNLKYLYASAAPIVAVPESIGNCESLIILDLHSTQITKIPDSVTKLKNLKSLDLGYTKITSLPENIGALSQLIRLDLFGLDIRQLPKSTRNLTKLEYLNVYDNFNLNEEYKKWFKNECYKCINDPQNNKDWDDGR